MMEKSFNHIVKTPHILILISVSNYLNTHDSLFELSQIFGKLLLPLSIIKGNSILSRAA
jgi:hypothetical protein